MLPNKLYKFTSQNWIEIPKSRTTTYLDNQEYVDYLSSKVQRGEIEMEDLTPQEQEELVGWVPYDKEQQDHNKMKKLTVVTEPNIYVMDQPSFLVIAKDEDIVKVCDYLRNINNNITVYISNGTDSLNWLLNSYANCDTVILDSSLDEFLTGFFIDKPKTFYYNSTNDYTSINIQTIEDPIRFLVDWTVKQKDN